jgi:hypothetical protein
MEVAIKVSAPRRDSLRIAIGSLLRVARHVSPCVLLTVSSVLISPRAVGFEAEQGAVRATELREEHKWPEQPIKAALSWTHAAAAPGDTSMLALGDGQVAFQTERGMCGFDADTGIQRWCSGKGTNPAYVDGTIAYVGIDGTLCAVSTRTGLTLWKRKGALRVWALGDDLVVFGDLPDNRHTNGSLRGLLDIGRHAMVRWSHPIDEPGDMVPFWFAPYMSWRQVSSGAFLTARMDFFVLGSGGGYLSAVPGWEVVSIKPPFAITNTAPNDVGSPKDNAVTFQFTIADLRTGKVASTWHFKPDYSHNTALYEAAPDDYSSNGFRVDRDWVYLNVGREIYRYRLADPSNQRPLLVASDARLLGGPYRGTIYVERNHQVLALTPSDHEIGALLIKATVSSIAGFSIIGNHGFVVENDGWVHGFDLGDGRPVLDVRPCTATSSSLLNRVATRVAATEKSAFLACSSDGAHWRVDAYRLASHS